MLIELNRRNSVSKRLAEDGAKGFIRLLRFYPAGFAVYIELGLFLSSTMIYRLFFLAVFAFFVAGCATYHPPIVDDFRGVELPPSGQARVYFLRPILNRTLKNDAPELSVDGVEIFDLAHGTYSSAILSPGTHVLSLRPHFDDSSLWDTSLKFAVEPDQAYFVALWNDVEYRSGFDLVPIMTGKGGFFLPMQTTVAHSTRVRAEVVSENDAKVFLRELRYVPAKKL
jgi:hypothetical protein